MQTARVVVMVALSAACVGSAQQEDAPQTRTGAQTAPAAGTATAVFAAGCFWCVEQAFDDVEGVLSTTSGYIGGRTPNPTYEEVSSGGTGHIEAVRITYDPSRVSYGTLVRTFWRNVDPLDAGGQFCDRGPQYRSAIFYSSDERQELAELSKRAVARELGKPVATEILPASEFYPAEDYHQDYYRKNPLRYKFYKWNCGRAQRLEELWGEDGASASLP